MGNYPRRRTNNKLVNGMKMWKGNENTTTLFSMKEREILHQERRGQVTTIVMEHLNSILFHKSEPANRQHTSQSMLHQMLQVLWRIIEKINILVLDNGKLINALLIIFNFIFLVWYLCKCCPHFFPSFIIKVILKDC